MKVRGMSKERIFNHPKIRITKLGSILPLISIDGESDGGWNTEHYLFDGVYEVDNEIHLKDETDEFIYKSGSKTYALFTKTIEEYL